jgi:hypothetical protein
MYFTERSLPYTQLTKEEKKKLKSKCYRIFLDIKNSQTRTRGYKFDMLREEIKQRYLPSQFQKDLLTDFDTTPQKFLPYLIKVSRDLHEINKFIRGESPSGCKKKRLPKPSAVFPLQKISIPSYTAFDTWTLIDLFYEKLDVQKSKGELKDNVELNKEMVWSSLFNIEKINSIRKTKFDFDHSLSTDGVGCSLKFVPKELTEKYKNNKKKDLGYYLEDMKPQEVERKRNYKRIARGIL